MTFDRITASPEHRRRSWSLALAVLAALTLGLFAAWVGGATASVPGSARTLVTFREEGGIRFQIRSLVVRARGQATATINGRAVRYHIRSPLWSRLRTVLEQTDA